MCVNSDNYADWIVTTISGNEDRHYGFCLCKNTPNSLAGRLLSVSIALPEVSEVLDVQIQ